jgi:hypothetical protein
MQELSFYIEQMTVPNRLIAFLSVVRRFLLGDVANFKSFKLPIFWLLDLVYGSCRWLKQRGIFF